MEKKDLSQLLAKAGELASKISADKDLLDSFTKDPVKTLEKKLGIDLPDDQANKLVDAIKAKLKLDKVSDVAEGLGKLFGK